MAVAASKDELVQIYTSNKNLDNLVYKVENVSRGVFYLQCVKTGKKIKAHRSRINRVLSEEETMDGIVVTETVETVETTASNIEEKALEVVEGQDTKETPAKKTTKTKPVKFDHNQYAENGFEIWIKKDLDFDIDTATVNAVCMINENAGSYETFNLYNDSLGKKGTRGQTYKFSEKNTIEKKRKQLAKKGYERYES